MKSQYSISTNQKTADQMKLAETSVEGRDFPVTSVRQRVGELKET